MTIIFWLRFWPYTIRALWRVGNGRWYVWRDAPTDIVRFNAIMTRYAKDGDEVQEMARQARIEYTQRKRRGEA